ncbi:MAG TPA: hypothetical protein VG142_11540 [Trebonia sp.]|jgi:hypothetical protein|nr:hypothetical protein [Trebonia sp.]
MSSLAILLAIVVAACSACGVLLAIILALSWGIHREDRNGTLTGPAPDWACWCTRRAAGFHRLRWDEFPAEAADDRTEIRVL